MNNQSNNHTAIFTMKFDEQVIKFCLLLILQIPSFFATIIILYHFKWKHLHSQIYGFLIIINGLIVTCELPITLIYLHEGRIRSENLCSGWIALNYSLFYLSIALMSWTSFERYLFIYHERLILRNYVYLHYIPIGCIMIYGPLFYVSTVMWHPCENDYDVERYVCGGACFQFEPVLSLIDWIGNVLTPVFLTLIINVIIMIRFLLQKQRMKRTINPMNRSLHWRRSLKLTAQLVAASMLYMIGWIPYTTIGLIQVFENTQQLAYLLSTIFVYIPYIQTLLLPMICLFFMPDVMKKFRSIFRRIFHQEQNHVRTIINRSGTKTTRRPIARRQ